MHLNQMATREELIAADPFVGRGVLLWMPGVDGADEQMELLASRLGMIVPAVLWPGIGAWVDCAAAGMTPGEAEARYQARPPWE